MRHIDSKAIIPPSLLTNRLGRNDAGRCWTIEGLLRALEQQGQSISKRTVERALLSENILPPALSLETLLDETGRPPKDGPAHALLESSRRHRSLSLFVQMHELPTGEVLLAANDGRQARRWVFLKGAEPNNNDLIQGLKTLCDRDEKRILLWPHGRLCAFFRKIANSDRRIAGDLATALAAYHPVIDVQGQSSRPSPVNADQERITHLDRLEAESLHIMREVAATAENPVMLYSVGKDSAVMLHLARKAFHPAPPPFPLLHIDTGWKFQEMIQFRDEAAADAGMRLIVHTNAEGVAHNINPIDHGSSVHTDIMKTQALRQALASMKFDMAFGGARRDEEKSRAKERIFSFRTSSHVWDPKNQRPELWNLYNTDLGTGESIRVFPISNWTERDVWQYTYREQIPVVPLYFAEVRPVIERNGMLIMVDDDRLQPLANEAMEFRKIRFRTLGCYPLTGGIESEADDLESIILELLEAQNSEREGRAIDHDTAASMEKKKQEGYF